MKNYLKKNGVKLGLIVLAVVLIVVFSSRALSGRADFLADAAGAVRAPFQKTASAVADWLESVYGYLYEYDKLQAENDVLRMQLAEAQQAARDGADALEENARYRELLNFAEKHSDFVMESAKIVSWNASNWSSTFSISKGEDAGLAVGDSVITEYGALVGQISELGDSWATVRTVIDVDTSIGALIGDDGSSAMVVGNFALMQQGTVKLTYATEGANMYQGEAVLTSGMGGYFPQGLNIGTISSVQTEAGGQTAYGIVSPACDYASLVQVFVIKDFDVVE